MPLFSTDAIYERFVVIRQSVMILLLCFLCSRLGQRTGIYYIDSTALAVCHNRRIGRHKTFAGLAAGQGQHGLVLRFQAAPGVQSP